ncbi:MAG: hypothetical protein ACRDWB_07425 [Acidimicrobiales bacterium]
MAEPTARVGRRTPVARMLTAFGRFWWEFLIGDTPELFIGAVLVVGLVALVCVDHGARSWAAVLLPLLVAGLLGSSVWRAKRRGAG